MWKGLQNFDNWGQIKVDLLKMAKKQFNSKQIANKLMNFQKYTDKIKFQQQLEAVYDYQALQNVYNANTIVDMYSKIANFVLNNNQFSIPILYSQIAQRIQLKKKQILYLYCQMMLSLIPFQQFYENPSIIHRFHHEMDFSFILSNQQYKSKTIVDYLLKQIQNKQSHDEILAIQRLVQKRTLEQIIHQNKGTPMSKFTIQSNQKSIQDYYGLLKTDFANQYIGGGALHSGCVQQQIMFANHPQLYTSQLLCQKMDPNEAILLQGFKKYSKNKGYGWTTQYGGQQTYKYQYNSKKIAKEYIVAIDAICLGSGKYSLCQFNKVNINRDILKAFVGFNVKKQYINTVVTGNWGCGAFGGDIRLKFLQSWIACSLAKKQMIYCPFGHLQKLEQKQLFQRLSKNSVDENYNLIIEAGSKIKTQQNSNIFEHLRQLI